MKLLNICKELCIVTLLFLFIFSCEQEDKKVRLKFSIFNFQETGSTTLSNFAIANGIEAYCPDYPVIIKTGGGSFETIIISGIEFSQVICEAIIIIQNEGTFILSIDNTVKEKSIEILNNKIIGQGILSFNYKNIRWYIQTTIVDYIYNVLVILSDSTPCGFSEKLIE